MTWTASDLLTNVKLRGLFPSTFTLEDTELLRIADGELQTLLYPQVIRTAEEYYVTYEDVPIVSGTSLYRIPTRAMLGRLRHLTLLAPDGNEYQIPQVPPERVTNYQTWNQSGFDPRLVFAMRGDRVFLSPVPDSGVSGYSLRMYFFRRPSRLVAEVSLSASQITAINTSSGLVSFSPAQIWTTANRFDFVQANPQFDVLAYGQTASSLSGGATFSSLPDDLAVGDWICLQGESPIVQLPELFHPLLESAVVIRCLVMLGDREGADAERMAYAEQLGLVQQILGAGRVKGATQRVINRHSPLRKGRA